MRLRATITIEWDAEPSWYPDGFTPEQAAAEEQARLVAEDVTPDELLALGDAEYRVEVVEP